MYQNVLHFLTLVKPLYVLLNLYTFLKRILKKFKKGYQVGSFKLYLLVLSNVKTKIITQNQSMASYRPTIHLFFVYLNDIQFQGGKF